MISLASVASLATGVVVASAVAHLVPPPARLAARVRPYAGPARSALGRAPDRITDDGRPIVWRVASPLVESVVSGLSRTVGPAGDVEAARRIRHAGMFSDLPEDRRVHELRVRQVGTALGAAVLGLVTGLALSLPPGPAMALALLGGAVGPLRLRARIDRRIEERRARLRMELTTVNQLLAMHVRVGGGVVQAVRRVVDRGRGELVDELREVLVAHESGVALRDALLRASTRTAEPHVARTLRLLATGSELGSDLAAALLANSHDVRAARRDAMRQEATRRRAAMLVPIIGVLAPVMLLFVAAPLPSIVLGVR